jgi:hypothetical protein
MPIILATWEVEGSMRIAIQDESMAGPSKIMRHYLKNKLKQKEKDWGHGSSTTKTKQTSKQKNPTNANTVLS